ncbi:hypothetical protein F5884DRAFT_815131 [Xylogone sp. PMI_703]|nr:hypothetical protein F5884DRAFT_815131 [Xylogone sp. PMI_703]
MQAPGDRPTSMAVKQFYKPGRRPRVPLSCDPCRTRKLKCNREKPCQNCIARDERATCRYKSSKNETTQPVPQGGQGDSMQQRLAHLEYLVKNLMAQHLNPSLNNRASSQSIPGAGSELATLTGDASDEAFRTGRTVIDGIYSVYKSSDDWYDVLQEITKLKDDWSQTHYDDLDFTSSYTPSHAVDGASLLFGHVKPIEIVEISASLPPKLEVDRMICQFFDQKSFPIIIPPILHQPTFMHEYNEHWKDPSQTNVIWLGLLFSILAIVMLSYHQFDEPAEYEGISESLFQLYRLRTAQCLISGDIAKCLPYTVETLRLNATAELNRKDDNSRGLWILMGVIIRAAVNMGYHRDPSHSPSISGLRAEYRRRVWFAVAGMDDVASFRVGFPRMTPAIYSDTCEPRNLHDWELLEDSGVLPPSRPLTEVTPVTYMILKGRLFRSLGRIIDFNNDPNSGSYETVLAIDGSLYEAYHNFPPHMKWNDGTGISSPIKNRSDMSKLQLETIYHQGMCTLHRTFVTKERLDPKFTISRDRCISSSLALLSSQHLLQPSWYRFSQTRKMLALAAMILMLELEHRQKRGPANTFPDSSAILQKLEKSCTLWEDAKGSCEEAQRVHKVMTHMISRFEPVGGVSTSSTPIPDLVAEIPRSNPRFHSSNDSTSLNKDLYFMSTEMDIDWATWDNFIDGAGFNGATY